LWIETMKRRSTMNRRVFLQRAALMGGTAVLAACGGRRKPVTPTPAAPSASPTAAQTVALAAAGASPGPRPTGQPATAASAPKLAATLTSTATPQAAAEDWRGTVVLVKTAGRTEGVRRAVELLGANTIRGKQVLLKANYNSADPSPGSTHLDTLRATITQLQGMGAGPITLGERSGMGDTRTVLQQMGVFDLARELGFETVVLDELEAGAWKVLRSPGDHWQRGYAMPLMLLDAEAVVQTCNLKTHRFGGHFTLSLKNSVGLAAKQVAGAGYNYMTELHGSPDQRLMIAEVNRTYAPALIVLDGVEAFTKGGPDRGTVVRPGVILAGRDRIALDAAGVAILRFFGTTPEVSAGRVFEQAQIARAVELGLGAQGPQDVRILTGDAASEAFAAQIRPLIT
jgi:uncharacterized protein (DUF362 family)